MARATADQFDAFHGLLCQSMQDELERYRRAGEGIPPAFLAQCLKLLKDNGVDSPARAVKLLDVLKDKMPSFEHAEYGVPN